MPTGTWVINHVLGGNDRSDLLGCLIRGTNNGYDFYSPAPNRVVLARSTSISAPITFTFNGYQGWNWTVTINNLTPRPSGSWSNNDVNLEGEIGTWDTGVGEDEEGEEDDAEGEEDDAEDEHSAD